MARDDEGKSAYEFFGMQAALNLYTLHKREQGGDVEEAGLPPETRLLLLRARAQEKGGRGHKKGQVL